MADARVHWETVYASKAETAVSWYQPQSLLSVQLIAQATASDLAAPIVDIGGGASTLVDDLLARDFRDITVLDIAGSALAKSKARLGARAGQVAWLEADITAWTPPRQWQVWHDRAVFHFLTDTLRQDAYIDALTAGTRPGATVIVSTFALDGPERCSGLPVQRYSPASLAARLGPAFVLTDEAREVHRTPSGSEQAFAYAILRRQ